MAWITSEHLMSPRLRARPFHRRGSGHDDLIPFIWRIDGRSVRDPQLPAGRLRDWRPLAWSLRCADPPDCRHYFFWRLRRPSPTIVCRAS